MDGSRSFAFSTYDWIYGVPAATTQVTVVVTPVDSNATVEFDATDADTNTDGHQVNLSVGLITMDLLVRAENGIHGTEYYLSIYRGENAVFGLWADASLFGMYEAGNRNLAGGIWSDGETLWAADTEDDKLYAYELAGGARDESKDFNTLSAAGNQDPAGIWSDRETMWVADSEDDMLYAYRMSDRTRKSFRDIESLGDAGNRDPAGLWSNGRTIWVSDSRDDKLYAYRLADGRRLPKSDFNDLSAYGNSNPSGIWSDGVTMWVADLTDDKLYAYRMSDRARDLDKEFDVSGEITGDRQSALWSDGRTLYALSPGNIAIFAYNLTIPGELDLGSITFKGTAVSGVSADQRSYTISGTVPLTADVTIAATASETDSSVDFSYPDLFSGATGHQIGLDEGDNLVQIFVRGEATYRTYELSVTAGDAPQDSTSKAWIPVDEDDDGAVHQFHGTIGELEDGRDFDWINVSLEADTLYAVILKGREFGETDRTLPVPYLGGLLTMSVYQDGTDAIGAFVTSGIDGLARVLFKPESSAVYQVVVAGALAEYTGIYDLRVRPYEDDHFPNSIETESEISFPTDSDAEHFPSASATGKINYALDSDWFKASGLVAGDEYVIEARHGRRFLLITIFDTDGDTVEAGYEQGRTMFVVPANGDYFIRVRPINRFNRARYTLYVHTLPLTGGPYVGSELSVSSDHIIDPDGVSRATAANRWAYQWYKVYSDGFETLIPGDTSSTYTPTDADSHLRFRAEICYRDDNSSVALECRSTRRSLPVQPLITVPHDWSSIPSGLNAGDRFRLLFVSEDKRTATPRLIWTYRNWIRSQAGKGHASIQGYKDHFTVLGSTSGRSAKDEAVINFNDQYAGVPIYWLRFRKAADDYADFCDGSWDYSSRGPNSTGWVITFNDGDLIYTGTLSTCERSPNNYLGATNVTVGQPSGGRGSELQETTRSRSTNRPLYGISFVFEVGEAPVSMQQQQGNSPAEGSVRISGTPQVGQTLLVNSAISDPDGTSGASYAYQWYAGDSEIAGATEFFYTLTTAERGRRITVAITFTYDAENEEVLTSEPTAAVTSLANNAATGQPTLTGTAQVGQTLNASTSAIADADGLDNATFVYQWLTDDTDISGATGSAYILTDSDQGKAVRVRVSFTDDAGHEETLTSESIVVPVRPHGLTAAVSDGAVVLTWNPPVGFSYLYDYQILRNRPELGEAEPLVYVNTGTAETTYTDTDVEPGVLYVYRVKAASYFARFTEASEPVEIRTAEAAANTPATGAPAISGDLVVGQTLSADTSAIEDDDGLTNPAFVYQWLADDTGISGATDSRYTLVDSDGGKAIKVTVSFTDDAANEESLTSAATAAVEPAPTLLTAEFLDTPSSHDGETAFTFELRLSEEFDLSHVTLRDHAFTVTGGEVTGARHLEPDSATPNIRWEITVAPDGNGDATVVLPATTDCTAQGAICTGDGKMLSGGVTVTVAGPEGEEQQQTPPENNPATGAPAISGTAQVGQTLTADTSGIADGDGTGDATFAYQWLADDTDIAGATGSSYTLTDSDEGKAIRVQVSFTDDAGNDETLTSAMTAAVAPRPNTPATGAPTISGAVQVEETLTADTSGITDEDGLTNVSFSYQWLADDTDISGATASSYTLVDSDEGKAIKVRVSFTDDAGNAESLTSSATAAVAAAPAPLTAEFLDTPSSHDGDTAFTFELRFSEEFELSYKTLRDHAFTVTGGEVTTARRLDRDSATPNIRWEITVRPVGNGGVTITLPETTNCSDTGAICTEDGRMLSTRLHFTVSGS